MLFSAERLPEVQGFDCGNNHPWEIEAAEWIGGSPDAGRPCALADMKKRRTEVWLYKLGSPDGDLVAFSSLGKSNWDFPPDPARIPINLVPWVGMQKRYWGKGDEGGKFSDQVFSDLISEARARTDREPVLGLYVHPQNRRAITFYHRIGFEEVPERSFTEDDVTYVAMMLNLEGLPQV